MGFEPQDDVFDPDAVVASVLDGSYFDEPKPVKGKGPVGPPKKALTQDELEDVLRQAGWEESLLPQMSAIGMAESALTPDGRAKIDSYNPGVGAGGRKTVEESIGPWQINMHPSLRRKYDRKRLASDPVYNAKAALEIYNQQGLKAWGAYKDGRYKKYLKKTASSEPAFDPNAVVSEILKGIPGFDPSTIKQGPVTETAATLDAQLQAARDPQSTRIGVLYTDQDTAPEIEVGEYDIRLPNGQLLRADAVKLTEYLEATGTSLADIRSGAADFTPLIGGKAEPTGEQYGTQGQVAVISYDEDGNELISSAISDPANIPVEAALQKKQFPNRKIRTEVVTGADVVAARQQPPAETPDGGFQEANAFLASQGQKPLTREEFDARVADGFGKTEVDSYQLRSGRQSNTLQQVAPKRPKNSTIPTVKVAGRSGGGIWRNVQVLQTDLRDAADPEEYLSRQGAYAMADELGVARSVADEWLATHGNDITAGKPFTEYELSLAVEGKPFTLNINNSLAKEFANFAGKGNEFVPNIETGDFTEVDKVTKAIDRMMYPDMLESEEEAEAAITKRTKDADYSWTERLKSVLSNPFSVMSPFGAGNELLTTPEDFTQREKARLKAQHGSFKSAAVAERYYQQMPWPETAIRVSGEILRSFAKNVFSATTKSGVFMSQMGEYVVPGNLLVPDEYRIGLRNAGNAAEFLTRLISSGSAETAIKDTKWVKGTDDIAKQPFFRAAQQFDNAIGEDPVLKGRWLGAAADAGGSALAFLALGAAMPALRTTNFWGKSKDFGLGVSGVMTMAGTGYEEAKAPGNGLTENQARFYGIASGLLGLTEMVGAGAELATLIKSGALKKAGLQKYLGTGLMEAAKNLGGTAKREAKQELAQEVFQTTAGNVLMEYLKDNDPSTLKKLTNALNRLPKQVASAIANEGIIAMLTGGLMGGATALAQQVAQKMAGVDTGALPVPVNPAMIGDFSEKGRKEFFDAIDAKVDSMIEAGDITQAEADQVKSRAREMADMPPEKAIQATREVLEAPAMEIVESPAADELGESKPNRLRYNPETATDAPQATASEGAAPYTVTDKEGTEFTVLEDRGEKGLLVQDAKGVQKVWPNRKFTSEQLAAIRDGGLKKVDPDQGETRVVYRLGWANEVDPSGRYVGDADRVAAHINTTEEGMKSAGDTLFAYRVPVSELLWDKQHLGNAAILPEGSKAKLISKMPYADQYGTGKAKTGEEWSMFEVAGDHIRKAFKQDKQAPPTRFSTPKISRVSEIKKGAIPEDPWAWFNKDVYDAAPAISTMVDPGKVVLTKPRERMDRDEMAFGRKHELVRAYNHLLDQSDGSPQGRKRDPIEVYKNEDGTFTVIDGNATVQLAQLLGWKQVPAVITKRPVGTVAPVNKEIAQLSRDVLDVAEGSKHQYFQDVRQAAAIAGGYVPATLRQYLTKSLDSLNKKLALKSGAVPTDLIRSTIVIPKGSLADAQERAAKIVESMGELGYKVLKNEKGQPDVTNRFADPAPGYKDIAIKFVKDDSPAVHELQLLQPATFTAKTGIWVDPVSGSYRTTKRFAQHINYDKVKDLQDTITNDPFLTPRRVKELLADIVKINAVMAEAYAASFARDTGLRASDSSTYRPSETIDASSSGFTGTPSESRNRIKASADLLSETVAKNLAAESLSSTERALKFFNDSDIYTSSPIVSDSESNSKGLESQEEVGLKKVDLGAGGSALGVFTEPKADKGRSAQKAIRTITRHMRGSMTTPVKEATNAEIEEAFYRNALIDLQHWIANYKDGYTSFYGDDVAKANDMLQVWAKETHGRELTTEEVDLFHLLGALSASGVEPREDSALATIMLDRYLRDGTISAKDPMRFRPEFVKGKPTGNIRFETDPETGRSVVGTGRYSTKVHPEPLNAFSRVLAHFNGDLKKTMAWVKSPHPLQELLDLSGQLELPTHEYLDAKNGGKGVFSLFSGTGAKLGSYYLNRIGDLSTVTRDMWYGRGEARYLGLPLANKDGSAIGGPLESKTVYGRRARVAEDAAIARLAKQFKVEPAIIQQWLWDFEQRLWDHAGMPATRPSYISEGVADGIKRLETRSAAGERSAATVGVGVVREGTGKTIKDTIAKFAQKAYKGALATNERILKAFNVNTSSTAAQFTVLNLHQQQNTIGVWEGTSASMEESALYTVSGPTDLVKAFAVTASILAPNPQQAVMLDTYDRNGEGDETHITFKDLAAIEDFVANRAKYNAGNLSLNPTTKTVIIVHNRITDDNPLRLDEVITDYAEQVTNIENRAVVTDFIDEGQYRSTLQEARDSVQRHYPGKRGQSISAILDEADARLRKEKPELYEEVQLKSVAPLENSLGIPRSEMPQIRREDHAEFIEFAKDRGVDIVEDSARAGDLLPTQNEYNPEQASQLPDRAFKKRLMVSRDNRVLDGHNTLVRLQEKPDQKVDIWRIDLPATTALGLMKDFPKVGYKTVAEVGPATSAIKEVRDDKGRLLAPNGKPSNLNEFQWKQVRTPEFKEFFGDWESDPENASKAVDENGEPKVLLHGSEASEIEEFLTGEEFGRREPGIFLTDDPTTADFFASKDLLPSVNGRYDQSSFDSALQAEYEEYGQESWMAQPTVYPVFVNMRKPKRGTGAEIDIIDATEDIEKAKDGGRDGLIVSGVNETGDSIGTTYVVFRSNQIKSAIGNRGTFDPNEDSILKKARTDESRQLRMELEVAYTRAVLARIGGGILHANGELELNEADAEILRRLIAERYFQRVGEEIDEMAFDGIMWNSAYARNLAQFGMTAGREMLTADGYSDAELARYDALMKALQDSADANDGHMIAYVYDDALPHERTHKEERGAGGVPADVEAKLLALPIAQTAGTPFDRAYPGISNQDKVSELAAIIATGEAAKYGLSTDPAAQQEFLRTWARGIIDNNIEQINEIGPQAWAAQYPIISGIAFATSQGEQNAENNQSTEVSTAGDQETGGPGAVPGAGLQGKAGGAQTADQEQAPAGQAVDSEQGQPSVNSDAGIAQLTGQTITEVKTKNRQFAQSLASSLFDIGNVEYEPQTVEGWEAGATETIEEKGLDGAIDEYRKMPAGSSEGRKTALGVAIAVEMYVDGRTDDLITFGRELTENIGNAAQELRAAALLSRLSPAFAAITGDKIVRKAKGRAMDSQERAVIDKLARELEEAADAHAFAQAALAEAKGLNEKFAERVKELEAELAAARRTSGGNAAANEKALADALALAEEYKRKLDAGAIKVKGPKALKDLRVKIETERPDLIALLQQQFPGTPLKLPAHHGTPHVFKAELLVEYPDGKREFIEGDVDKMPAVPKGAKVIKEFPHGRMKLAKVGTGEGHQAYGHGLYFASKEKIADWYRSQLSPGSYVTYNGERAPAMRDANDPRGGAIYLVSTKILLDGKTPADAIADTIYFATRRRVRATEWLKQNPGALASERERYEFEAEYEKKTVAALKRMDPTKFQTKSGGARYNVDLKPGENEYLDWDVTYTRQSKTVREALGTPEELIKSLGGTVSSFDWSDGPVSGEDVMDWKGIPKADQDKLWRELPQWQRDAGIKEYRAEHPDSIRAEVFIRGRTYVGIADTKQEAVARAVDQMTGAAIYHALSGQAIRSLNYGKPSQEFASNWLLQRGIRGNKYLDGDSRHGNAGSYNYVIFNDRDVAIESVLKKVDPQTLTPQFKNWFKDSKIVDEDGRPLVVYHGTEQKFDTFDLKKVGKSSGNRGFLGSGIYLSPDKFIASAYGNPMPLYVRIENPFRVEGTLDAKTADILNDVSGTGAFSAGDTSNDVYNGLMEGVAYQPEMADEITSKLKDLGYDGVIFKGRDKNEIVAFEPTQIKSAIGNNGDFNPDEGSILKSTIPDDLNVPPEAIEALVKLSAAKLIDEVPTGLTPTQFDKWLNEITGGRLGPREVAVIHALAHEMTRPVYEPKDFDQKFHTKNRIAHKQRADRILIAEGLTDVTPEGIAEYKAAHAKQGPKKSEGKWPWPKAGPKKPPTLVNRVLGLGEDLGVDEQTVTMATAQMAMPDDKRLRQIYNTKFPDGGAKGYAAAMNAGKQLVDMARDQATAEKWEAKAGEGATKKEALDLERAMKDLATEERLKRKALEIQFKRLEETGTDKVLGAVSSIYNLPRSVMFSGDLGFLFAQGLPTLLMHPTAWWKAVSTGIPAALTDERFEQAITEVYNSTQRKALEASGTKFEQIGNVADFNDDFMSDLGRRIPFVKQTNRAHSLTTDLFRLYGGSADLAELDAMYQAGKLGATPEENAFNYNRSKEFLAKKWVNVMSGKGYLGVFDILGKAMAQAGSAPRYTVSAFQTPYYANPLRAAFLPKGARKIMMKNSAKLWIPIVGFMLLLSKLGLINDDPEDKDFLQIDAGKLLGIEDMKINPLRALKEPLRLTVGLPAKMLYYQITGNEEGVARLAKSYYAAFIIDNYGGMGSFWKSKLHPSLSMASMVITGKNFVGEPAGWMDILPLPLGIKESYQAATYDRTQSILKTGADTGKIQDNWRRVMATLVASTVGWGANSFPGSDTTIATKQLLSMMGPNGDDRTEIEKAQSQKANQIERLIREGQDVSELIQAALGANEITKKQAEALARTLEDDLGDVESRFGMKFTDEERTVLMNNRKALKILDYLYTDRKVDWKKIDTALKFATPEENRLNGREALAAAEAIVLEAVLRSERITGPGVTTDDMVEMYKALAPRMTQADRDIFLQRLEKKARNSNKGGDLDPDELERIKEVAPNIGIIPRAKGTHPAVYKIQELGSVEKALADPSVKRWSTDDWVAVLKTDLPAPDRVLAETALKRKAENARKSKTLTKEEVDRINSVLPGFKIWADSSRGTSTTKNSGIDPWDQQRPSENVIDLRKN